MAAMGSDNQGALLGAKQGQNGATKTQHWLGKTISLNESKANLLCGRYHPFD